MPRSCAYLLCIALLVPGCVFIGLGVCVCTSVLKWVCLVLSWECVSSQSRSHVVSRYVVCVCMCMCQRLGGCLCVSDISRNPETCHTLLSPHLSQQFFMESPKKLENQNIQENFLGCQKQCSLERQEWVSTEATEQILGSAKPKHLLGAAFHAVDPVSSSV